ncbi:Carcinoembryonic antigen-related cell adhesion molecule 21, partial [Galemys pyrenaicus]
REPRAAADTMESSPDHGRRGRVPWMGLLLAGLPFPSQHFGPHSDQFLPLPPASLLTVWTPPVTAKITVEPEPPCAAEGQDVLLRVRDVPGSPVLYEWFRGATTDSKQLIMSYKVESQTSTPGHAHSGRETVRADGSLLIRNVSGSAAPSLGSCGLLGIQVFGFTRTDTGPCVCETQNPGRAQRSDPLALNVLCSYLSCFSTEPVARPSIRASNTTVTEHEGRVVLTCLTDDTGISTLWLFNNQSLQPTERMKLSLDKDTLTIYPVGREDAGEYQCEVSNLVSASRSDPLTLTVKGAKTDIVIGVLVLVALAAALGCVLFVKSSGRTSRPHGLRVQKVQAPTPGKCLFTQERWEPLALLCALLPVTLELQDSSANIYCQINDKADALVALTVHKSHFNTTLLQNEHPGQRGRGLLPLLRNLTRQYLPLRLAHGAATCVSPQPLHTYQQLSSFPEDPWGLSRQNHLGQGTHIPKTSCQGPEPQFTGSSDISFHVCHEMRERGLQEFHVLRCTTYEPAPPDRPAEGAAQSSQGPRYLGYNSGVAKSKSESSSVNLYSLPVALRDRDLRREHGQGPGPLSLSHLHCFSTDPKTRSSIRASNTTVTEHQDNVVLTCVTRDTGLFILWLFHNQRLQPTDRMTLSRDKSSPTISSL